MKTGLEKIYADSPAERQKGALVFGIFFAGFGIYELTHPGEVEASKRPFMQFIADAFGPNGQAWGSIVLGGFFIALAAVDYLRARRALGRSETGR